MYQKGDVLLWKGNRYTDNFFLKLISALISYFQERSEIGDYTHAGIADDNLILSFIEAVPPVIHETKFTIQDFIENEIEYYEVIGATDEDKSNAVHIAQTKIGMPYDILALFGIVYTNPNTALYCVRLACMCYPNQLWKRFKDDKLISPDELIASGLLKYKGNLSREQLPDYWNAKPIDIKGE